MYHEPSINLNHPILPKHQGAMIFCFQYCKLQQQDKTVVINDPLGQTHNLAIGDHCFHFVCFVLLDFEKWRRTYGRTDTMCENNDPYRP